ILVRQSAAARGTRRASQEWSVVERAAVPSTIGTDRSCLQLFADWTGTPYDAEGELMVVVAAPRISAD
ncbi:MAG: hypothetical protein U0838_17910, partial [Chloroflexota bacterium]